jgi:hypothetical protein
MWSSVVLALPIALDPVRLGVNLSADLQTAPGAKPARVRGRLRKRELRLTACPAFGALAVAALMAVRLVTRQRAQVMAGNAKTSTLVADSDASTPASRLLKRGQDAPAEGGSAIQRLLGRAHNAWGSGAVVFIVASLAVVEIVLISNMVAPTKTQAALGLLHDWVRGYRRQILVAILTLVGIVFVAQGTGSL